MKTMMTLLTVTCALALVMPISANAQECPAGGAAAIPLACGGSVDGDTTGLVNNFGAADYSCAIQYNKASPESYLVFTLAESSAVNLEVLTGGGGWDTEILLLSADANGACDPGACLAVAETVSNPEVINTFLNPGTYFLIVDGWGGEEGPFTASLTCTPCSDGDGDGYADAACGGNDCDDANPAINPGEFEVCGDVGDVDEDCDGTAQACPDCTADGVLDCATPSGSATTVGQTNAIIDYCGFGDDSWTGPEYIYSLQSANDAFIDFALSNTVDDLDLLVIWPYAAGVCNPGLCVAVESTVSGDEATGFWATGGQTYYLSIDGWGGAESAFDYTLNCLIEACTADGSLACGENVDATTVGGSTDITYYGGLDFPFPGAEYTTSFTAAYDGLVTVDLIINDPVRLALLVLEDDGSGCAPSTFIAGADKDNIGSGDFTEQVIFQAAAGTTYYIVVDSQIVDAAGSINLAVGCVLDCGAMTQCGDICVDTDVDTDNCGGCGTVCNLANTDQHACAAGICEIVTCDANFDDCDVTDANGCEANLLTNPATCGNCQTACSAPTPNCTGGICTDSCGANLTDCGGSCVDTDTDEAHCGACDNDCNANVGNVNDATCAAGVCGYDACSAGYLDCDADATNGCEALESPAICGAGCVDCSASVTNVDNVLCTAGACDFDACTAGFLNCDANDANGCELAIDDANCGVCGNDCGANAACDAGVCACDDGYANCDAAAGCETMLGSVDDCLACDDACGANGACDAVAGCGCADGYADCDEDVATGCEIMLGSVDHCGFCGDDCGYENGTGACNAGVCGLDSCNANFADCDGNEATGCETALTAGSNCGACGVVCGALEACTGDDVNGYACTDTCSDTDADGFADAECGGADCDDSDAAVNPDADEACNDADDDCDGTIDEGFDADADGYKSCGAMADCNDADPAVNPGATEICQDGVDNDCAGGDAACACADADKDGYQAVSCGGTDCNDADIRVNPVALEICDEIDNNCNGQIDEEGACDGGTSGCGCASANSSPAAGGLLLLALVLGLALPRRRNS